MQTSVVQIGNFSYYPSKVVGQGATGSVYLGNFYIMQDLEIKT